MSVRSQFIIDMSEATDGEWSEFILDLEAGILNGEVIVGVGLGTAHMVFKSMLANLNGGEDVAVVEREEQRAREAHDRAQNYPGLPFGWS